MSYEIPPAPKPFTGRHSPALGYFPLPSVSVARNLDVRQTQSPSRAEDTEYYIAFPPSGLPIHGNFKLNRESNLMTTQESERRLKDRKDLKHDFDNLLNEMPRIFDLRNE